jgi:putative methyltransferase
MLRHAMSFPSAQRIVYSTCSVAAAENEAVVVAALASDEGRGWTLLAREQQPGGLRRWGRRGDAVACGAALLALEGEGRGAGALGLDSPAAVANCCVRCEKGGPAGTIGFFVAGFVRGGVQPQLTEEEDEEWNGFSDGD